MSREVFGRMTPTTQEIYDLQVLTEHFNNIFDVYVLSQEESNKKVIHYHFYAQIPENISNQTIKARIKGYKQQQFKMEVYISNKDVQSKLKAIAYTIKDGNYTQKGIDYFTMNKAKQETFKKVNFQNEVNNLKQLFQEGKITHRQVVRDVLNLYKICKNSFHQQHAIATVNYIMLFNESKFKAMEDRIVEYTSLGSKYDHYYSVSEEEYGEP